MHVPAVSEKGLNKILCAVYKVQLLLHCVNSAETAVPR